ncbi:MAG: hypothetical protein M3O50_02670 [Myxococcota bacterium]|nr:hypothetical protein [Myxococcota bacterium]
MKRLWGHVLAGLSLLFGAAAVFPACVHDNSAIFVRDVLAPILVTNSAGCAYSADPAQAYITSGVLDVALRSEYDATYLVGNQLVPEVNPGQLQTETSIVTVQGGVVRITDSAGTQLRTFTRLASTSINPASGGIPTYGAVTVTTIDALTLANSADVQSRVVSGGGTVRLVTFVRFFGTTTGGKSVESGEYEFPVDICRNCLVRCGTTTAGAAMSEPCAYGQDAPVTIDCTATGGGDAGAG